jgi:hypothetical protein
VKTPSYALRTAQGKALDSYSASTVAFMLGCNAHW